MKTNRKAVSNDEVRYFDGFYPFTEIVRTNKNMKKPHMFALLYYKKVVALGSYNGKDRGIFSDVVHSRIGLLSDIDALCNIPSDDAKRLDKLIRKYKVVDCKELPEPEKLIYQGYHGDNVYEVFQSIWTHKYNLYNSSRTNKESPRTRIVQGIDRKETQERLGRLMNFKVIIR